MDAVKASAYVTRNLDEDGTPLTIDGERMVELRPGVWQHPLAAAFMELAKSGDWAS